MKTITSGKTTKSAQGFRLTSRDIAILNAVYEYRVLSRFHIEKLFFPPGATSRCILRLGLLHEHGFLDRQEQASKPSEGRKPYLYLLTEKAAHKLADELDCERGDIAWRPADNQLKPLFLDHLLQTQDVRVAVAVSAREHGFELLRWVDEGRLRREHAYDLVTVRGAKGGTQKIAVVPDSYFDLRAGRRGHFFVEIDRGTVTADALDFTQRDWEKKIRAYQEYQASGLFEARYKAPAFRVLTVTVGERRLSRLQQITERANGRSRYWFTTFERIKDADILTDPVWTVASRGQQRVSLIE